MILDDKKGRPFEVKDYRPENYPDLVDMYDAFSPKARFQGMPPGEKNLRDKWIKGLVEGGENILAWRKGEVIGHVVLIPDFSKGDAEYLIFVNQFNRGLGLGRALTEAAIKKADRMSLVTLWLTVDAYNFRAIRLYKSFGFQFLDDYRSPSERMMFFHLRPKYGT